MRRGTAMLVCLLTAFAHAAAKVPYRQGALKTILPWPLEHGEWEISAGAAYRDDARPPFLGDDPGFVREEWRLDLIDVGYGLGGGSEVRLEFGLQRFEEAGGDQAAGIQDARISFGYAFPAGAALEAAAHAVVKLPNASAQERLGTDQTDLILIGALGGAPGRWGWVFNAGLGILGHPQQPGTQDDVLMAGLAGWWNAAGDSAWRSAFIEIRGAAGSRFGNDERSAGAGILLFRRLPVSLAVRYGLTDESPDWSASLRLMILDPLRR